MNRDGCGRSLYRVFRHWDNLTFWRGCCSLSIDYGLYGDDVAVGAEGDGVLAYWCLLSMYRPANQVHKDGCGTTFK